MIPDLLETVYIYLLNIIFKPYGKLFQLYKYLTLFNKMFIFLLARIQYMRGGDEVHWCCPMDAKQLSYVFIQFYNYC